MNLRHLRQILLTAGLAALLLPCLLPAQCAPAKAEEDPEIKLGRQNAEENDKSVKLLTTPEVVERVNRIGQKLAAVANSETVPALWGDSRFKEFPYTYKVVDDKDVNAYSMPGGFIYVNKGLIDFVHSDDELAGVLAHETAHAAHHHMLKLIREQNKMQPAVIGAIAALIVGKASATDMGNWIFAGQLFMTAKLNTYGVEAEKDADNAGAIYMAKAKYNPVGLLTFMERMARKEVMGPEQVLGIYRTHPPSPARVSALMAELQEMNIPIERRKVDPAIRADTTVVTVDGAEMSEIKMSGVMVTRVTASDKQTAAERSTAICDRLNELFDGGLMMSDIRLTKAGNSVIARGATLISFSPADAQAQKKTASQMAQAVVTALQQLLWQERFNRAPVTAGNE